MSQLNFGRPYGTITPPLNGAVFQQNDEYYDALGHRLAKDESGLPIAVALDPEEIDPDTLPTAHELLINKDKMPFFKWKGHAKRILGPESPGNKDGLVEMLKSVRNNQVGMHRAPDPAVENQTATEAEISKQDLDPAQNGDVDIVGWAKGEKQYLMAQITKVIRARFHIQCTTMRDAIDFLIQQGVVTGEEAMQVE